MRGRKFFFLSLSLFCSVLSLYLYRCDTYIEHVYVCVGAWGRGGNCGEEEGVGAAKA